MSYVVSTWLGGLRDDATKIDAPTRHWPSLAVAIARELSLPVRYIGVGEKINDLLEFDSRAFVDSLLGS